ncbi:hypothetical protein ACWIUD_05125 [Helicobacter sp. 23-1044]
MQIAESASTLSLRDTKCRSNLLDSAKFAEFILNCHSRAKHKV